MRLVPTPRSRSSWLAGRCHFAAGPRGDDARRARAVISDAHRTRPQGDTDLCALTRTRTRAHPRDPAERFNSHLKFIVQTYGAMYKWPGIAAAFAPGRKDGGWWRAFVPALFDNYMTRSLGGEAVLAMSPELLEAGAAMYVQLARVMLAQYDVVMVLEVRGTEGNVRHTTCCIRG